MPTVLVVDDAAVDRRLAGGLLERDPNLDIVYAVSGADALAQLDRSVPDLVVTDLQMPDIDGLCLVNTISDQYPEVPVVLMTAHGSEQIAAKALASGAASYVPKAELADTLHDTVMQILAMSESDLRYKRLIECSVETDFIFELENDLTLIDPLVDLVQQVITSMSLCDSGDRVRVGVALEHAVSNAMLRGNLEIDAVGTHLVDPLVVKQRREQMPFRDRRVTVKIEVTREEARFTVTDQGPGFDTGIVPASGDPDAMRAGMGRGLVLMMTFMDKVSFNEKGNVVVLVKRKDGDETKCVV